MEFVKKYETTGTQNEQKDKEEKSFVVSQTVVEENSAIMCTGKELAYYENPWLAYKCSKCVLVESFAGINKYYTHNIR
jgi:hypothetical protein